MKNNIFHENNTSTRHLTVALHCQAILNRIPKIGFF